MTHSHTEKIRVGWLGEGTRVLRNWLTLVLVLSVAATATATAASAAHVRLKGPSLLFIGHCVVVVGADVRLDVKEEGRRAALIIEATWAPRERGANRCQEERATGRKVGQTEDGLRGL